MKGKLIICIVVLFYLANAITYQLAFAVETNEALLSVLVLLFVLIILITFKIIFDKTPFHKMEMLNQYKSHIGGAFKDNKRAKSILASALWDLYNNKLKNALKKLDKLYNNFCGSFEEYRTVLLFKAICYGNMKLPYQAIDCYKKLLSYDSYISTAWSNLGLLYKQIGKTKEAENALKYAIDCDPQNSFAYNNLGTFYYSTGDYESAIWQLKKALEINPRMLQPMGTLAVIYSIKRNNELAKKYLTLYASNGGDKEKIKRVIEKIT